MTHVLARVGAGSLVALLLATALGRGVTAQSAVPTPESTIGFVPFVDLIGHTRTAAGLRVKAKLDTRTYPTGVPVSRAQMDTIALLPDTFHGEWNYELLPR